MRKFTIILILMAFVLSGCINVKREIKIDASGKGSEKMSLDIGKEFMRFIVGMSVDDEKSVNYNYLTEAVKEEMSKVPGVKLNSVTTVKGKDSSNIVNIDYNFSKVSLISSSFKGEINNDSTVSYYTVGNNVYFTYKINMSQKEPGDSSGTGPDDIDMSNFKNDKYIISVDFPYNIVYNNGISIKGKKVIWEIPMKEVLGSEPVILKVVMNK